MNIPYTDTIFLGIIRFLLWVLFLFAVKRLLFKEAHSQNQVKKMGNLWAFYGSIVLVGIFILVQLGSYDLFTCIVLLLLFFGFRAFGIVKPAVSKRLFQRKSRMMLLRVIENVEDKDPIIDLQRKKGKKTFRVKTEFIVASLVAIGAMLVRYYLLQFDNYQLSANWFEELTTINNISNQKWFSQDLYLSGQFALMNFYGLVTGISPEMTLESFGLLQALILCFVIFWFMDAMTNSLITIPLLSALAFALLFNLAPINIAQVTHSRPTLMALTFALPAMMFIRKPWKLYQAQPRAYFFGMLMLFTAIALTDFFTTLILLPPFFVVALLFLRKRYVKYMTQAFMAFLTALTLVFGYYAYTCYALDVDFGVFIRTNLLAINASTTTDNMFYDYNMFLMIVHLTSLVTGIIMFALWKKQNRKWAGPLSFLVYINFMIGISYLNIPFFDTDLFNETLAVFVACAIGIMFYVAYYFFNTRLPRLKIADKVSVPVIVLVFLVMAYRAQQPLIDRTQKSNTVSKNVLEAYQEIKSNYAPYGYAVINANSLQPISAKSHNFISYIEFTEDYAARDSTYFARKEDLNFLRNNSEFILPNSTLVFLYDSLTNEFESKVNVESQLIKKVSDQIALLESKGRKVRLVFKKKGITVYEIVNNPGEARISEML